MARLTRAESQAHTRAQLIATAKAMFFRDGFAATSLDKVAESAGYSKGAVYSNFRNKDELCRAVLAEIRAERVGEVAAILGAAGDMQATFDQLQAWANRVIGDPEWTTLELEYAIQARRNRELHADLAAQQTSILDLISGATAAMDLQPRLQIRELATVGLALGIGLGLLRSIDPSLSVDGLVDTIRILAGAPDEQ